MRRECNDGTGYYACELSWEGMQRRHKWTRGRREHDGWAGPHSLPPSVPAANTGPIERIIRWNGPRRMDRIRLEKQLI